jgi:hypothetical protein
MAVVDHYGQFLKLGLSDAEEHDLIEYLNCFNHQLIIRMSLSHRSQRMENKKTAVFGLYSGSLATERAVETLVKAGFSNNAISVLLPDQQSTQDFAHEKHTKAPEGTATGVTTGGAVGGALGLLAGIGALAIPGVGPFIAAGPIMATLAGLGVGGAVGGLIGALVGMGIPEYEAKRYEGRLKEGGVLLSVHCDTADQIRRSKGILTGTGASDIASTSETSVGSSAVPVTA